MRLPMPPRVHGLYAIVDPALLPDADPAQLCGIAARGGARVVQLRWKAASARELVATLRAAAPLVHGHGALLVLNDRPDLAAIGGADGVHVGADDLPADAARAIVGPDRLVGATVRDLAEARAAAAAGADHVGYGPIFATSTKQLEVAPRGLDALHHVAAGSPVPVVAIAGIDATNIAAVAAAGAHAAAVVSAWLRAPDPEAALASLAAAFAAGAQKARRA